MQYVIGIAGCLLVRLFLGELQPSGVPQTQWKHSAVRDFIDRSEPTRSVWLVRIAARAVPAKMFLRDRGPSTLQLAAAPAPDAPVLIVQHYCTWQYAYRTYVRSCPACAGDSSHHRALSMTVACMQSMSSVREHCLSASSRSQAAPPQINQVNSIDQVRNVHKLDVEQRSCRDVMRKLRSLGCPHGQQRSTALATHLGYAHDAQAAGTQGRQRMQDNGAAGWNESSFLDKQKTRAKV